MHSLQGAELRVLGQRQLTQILNGFGDFGHKQNHLRDLT